MNFHLDIATLIVCMCGILFVNSLTTYVLHRLHPELRGPAFWASGFTLCFLAFVLIILRADLPSLLSVLVANTLLIIGVALYYFGMCRFVDVRPQYGLLGVVLVATFVPFVLWYNSPEHLTERIIASCGGLSIVYGMTAWSCALAQGKKSNVRNLVAGIFAFLSVINMIRALTVNISLIGSNVFFSGINTELFYMAITLSLVMLVVGFALMISEKLRFELANRVTELKVAHDALEELSLTDALTGLANRRRFDEVLNAECRRMHRSHDPISLLMIDVDYFKSFNDTYGHLEGDECLRIVSEVIKKVVKRPQDLAARYGGEEFSCILPETDQKAAIAIAHTIKDRIAAVEMLHGSSSVSDYVTVSLGVATIVCSDGFSPEHIVKIADEHLYWAKDNGRNCVGYNGVDKVERIATFNS